ncbi:MAG: sodium:proton antiporter [Holosporales bacterium]|jgi:Na+/H+ antiporter NhaD/arsenite permease-like protein|nr:sodium:proton antiporter [Holosporales bacterium]
MHFTAVWPFLRNEIWSTHVVPNNETICYNLECLVCVLEIVLDILEIVVLSAPLFVILLSLAFMPLVAPRFWHKQETSIFWIISITSIISSYAYIPCASEILKHSLAEDYLPFIIMVFTLYVLSHGIKIKLKSSSSSISNIIFLGGCSLFSSLIGTTGASVLFLPSFLEMNKNRKYKAHLVIFFIFLIANIGGILTPLGDAPILLGYLHGVDFFWPLKHLFKYWLSYTIACLIILFIVDKKILKKEDEQKPEGRKVKFSLKVSGWRNIFLLLCTAIVLSLNIGTNIKINGMEFSPMVIKNAILLIFSWISLSTKDRDRIDFKPFIEVAKTFLVIFIVIAPVVFLLNENFATIHDFVVNASNGGDGRNSYFWLCALTSAFLDNAPSYLLFFNIAGGSACDLMYLHPNILIALSVSSVVMGAMTYIGNAPNLMVRSIAIRKGIEMPSFVKYMAWSFAVIVPVSVVLMFFL